MPLFHSNSTGNLGNQQYHQVSDVTSFAMGGGDINVAYDGTFGDLSSAGDADLFNFNGSFDFQLMDSGDSFTASNEGTNNAGTISPKDLFNDSVPPSTSFTNLTTPGSTVLETPDDYQTSPLFNETMTAEQSSWFSLFPEESNDASGAPLMKRSSSSQIIVHPGGESNHRKRSSTAAAPSPTFSPVVKHSQVAGVNARKRDKPLPPIVVDEADPIALKRARNTAAARKSRAKKVAERDDLESTIADLQAQVEHWRQRALAAEGASE